MGKNKKNPVKKRTVIAIILGVFGLCSCVASSDGDIEYATIPGGTYVATSHVAINTYAILCDAQSQLKKRTEKNNWERIALIETEKVTMMNAGHILKTSTKVPLDCVVEKHGRFAKAVVLGRNLTVWVRYGKLEVLQKVKTPLERILSGEAFDKGTLEGTITKESYAKQSSKEKS